MSEYQRKNPGLAYEPTGQEFGSGSESQGDRSPQGSSGRSSRPVTG